MTLLLLCSHHGRAMNRLWFTCMQTNATFEACRKAPHWSRWTNPFGVLGAWSTTQSQNAAAFVLYWSSFVSLAIRIYRRMNTQEYSVQWRRVCVCVTPTAEFLCMKTYNIIMCVLSFSLGILQSCHPNRIELGVHLLDHTRFGIFGRHRDISALP